MCHQQQISSCWFETEAEALQFALALKQRGVIVKALARLSTGDCVRIFRWHTGTERHADRGARRGVFGQGLVSVDAECGSEGRSPVISVSCSCGLPF